MGGLKILEERCKQIEKNNAKHDAKQKQRNLIEFLKKEVVGKMGGRICCWAVVMSDEGGGKIKTKFKIEIETDDSQEDFDRLSELLPICQNFGRLAVEGELIEFHAGQGCNGASDK
jgi:hypothetical protein